MTLSRSVFSLCAASMLVCASGVAAAAGTGSTKGSLHLYEEVTVQGKQLPPGDYKVEWNGEGPNVNLTIDQGRKIVISVPAQVTPVTEKKQSDGYVSTKEPDGQNALREIFFHGKDYELKLQDQPGASAAQSGTGGSNR
jgi:hypothetical protein